MGEDGRPLVTKNSFRFLQTLYNLGPAPEPNLTVLWSDEAARGLQALLRPGLDRHRPRSSTSPTSSSAATGATTRRSRAASRRCASASRCSSSAPGSTSPRRCSMRSTADATRCPASRSPRRHRPDRPDDVLDFDDVRRPLLDMLDWLAEIYVNALNVIHYMHDKYAYERIEMALHDRVVLRTMACGIAGLSVVADSLSAIKYAKVTPDPRRHRPGRRLRDRRRATRRSATTTTASTTSPLAWSTRFMEKIRQYPDVPGRHAHPVRAHHHLQRGLRQGDRQHARRPAARASPSRRAPTR